MRQPKRILVPVDFSAYSDSAVDHVVFLAKRFDADVAALRVLPIAARDRVPFPPPVPALEVRSFSATEDGRSMRRYLEQFEKEGIAARGRAEYGQPGKV